MIIIQEEEAIKVLQGLANELEVVLKSNENFLLNNVYKHRLEVFRLAISALRKQISER